MCEDEGGNEVHEVSLGIVSGQILFQVEARGEGQDLRANEVMNHHELRQSSTDLPSNSQREFSPSSLADTEGKLD